MTKLVFVGFDRDYEKKEIDLVKNKFHTSEFEIYRLIYIFFRKTKLYKLSVFSYVIYFITNIFFSQNSIFLIKDNIVYSNLFRRVKNKVLIFRNTYRDEFEEVVKYYQVIYSFDSDDCKNYNFSKYEQFSSGFEYIKKNKIYPEIDVGFIGLDKGRKELLVNLKEAIEKVGFTCHIEIIEQNSQVSYEDFLKKSLNYNVFLDIIKEGQSTETMRFLEAQLASRKIITNNANIVSHPLYSKENVYILPSKIDRLDKISLYYFLSSPFVLTKDNKLKIEKYDPLYLYSLIALGYKK
ncbi:hypothetical protein D0812_16195 [Vibrio owensii]|uniref:Uncharacterized protein n=1 Tax=Vibrio owensii TaxID=696485 RepID=A0AAP9GES4_9VIBR|nr:hypothetical protein [Vibrio owensii]AYO15863.1 hypothetical protein D0812_16195 [Vibrio owensii]QGH48487.1 hypothetical protein APZ19_15875 [Vibrio owensii]